MARQSIGPTARRARCAWHARVGRINVAAPTHRPPVMAPAPEAPAQAGQAQGAGGGSRHTWRSSSFARPAGLAQGGAGEVGRSVGGVDCARLGPRRTASGAGIGASHRADGRTCARLAQLDRALASEAKGQWFEPTIAHHLELVSQLRGTPSASEMFDLGTRLLPFARSGTRGDGRRSAAAGFATSRWRGLCARLSVGRHGALVILTAGANAT